MGKHQLAVRLRQVAATTGTSKMAALFNETCENDPAAAQVSFPELEAGMHRAKRMTNPKNPSSTDEFVALLNEYQEELGFNYRGTATSGEHSAVIFASDDAEAKLNSGIIVKINFNGTYLSCPGPFTQTWIIMGVFMGKVFAMITVLMTGKPKRLYKAVLEKIKGLYPNFCPTKAMGDFELAARNALKETFPEVHVSSCQFHHGQICNRAVCRIGMKVE
jgi:hypothetical protein